jgi:hypothetical protein
MSSSARARIFLFLGGLLAACALLEAGLRIFPRHEPPMNNPYQLVRFEAGSPWGTPFGSYAEVYPLEFDPRGYYAPSEGRIRYTFDQFGGRWVEPVRRKLGKHVAAIVGDSYAYGFGLRYEDTFAFRLSKLLPNWDFVNLARPGNDSNMALRDYRENRARFPHEFLIYGLNLNDLIQHPASYVITDLARGSLWARYSKFADFLFAQWDSRVGRKQRISEITSPEALERPFFHENFAAILKMRDSARAGGKRFLVVLLPELVDLGKYPFAPAFAAIAERLRAEGIAVADLSRLPPQYQDRDLWITPFDQHPNEIANRLFAESLAAQWESFH